MSINTEAPRQQSVLDQAISPAAAVEALAKRGIPVSERALREKARRIGAYREIGQAMFFLPADLEKIIEPVTATKKQIVSKPAKKRPVRTPAASPVIRPIPFHRTDQG